MIMKNECTQGMYGEFVLKTVIWSKHNRKLKPNDI